MRKTPVLTGHHVLITTVCCFSGCRGDCVIMKLVRRQKQTLTSRSPSPAPSLHFAYRINYKHDTQPPTANRHLRAHVRVRVA